MDFFSIDFLIRIVAALILGFFIGLERELTNKCAGLRTHILVCLGACVFTIISIYGFPSYATGDNVIVDQATGIRDTGRVAAQVVSGIGFIGAGMIFYHKQVVHGLTTAAGIWATAAIGMAVGAGLFIIAVISTSIIILVQCVMHLNVKIFRSRHYLRLNILFVCKGQGEREKVKEIFKVKRFTKINAKKEGDEILYSVTVTIDKTFSDNEIYNALIENSFIKSITREDEAF